jgi:hypothetical protein
VSLSLVHVAVMFGLRFAIYPLLGGPTTHGDAGGIFVYEYRKDVSTLLQMGLGLYFNSMARRAPCRGGTTARRGGARPRSEVIVVVQDGPLGPISSRSARSDRVRAAGNYVEIAWARPHAAPPHHPDSARASLGGRTGFVRIHRGTARARASVVASRLSRAGDFLASWGAARSSAAVAATARRSTRRYRHHSRARAHAIARFPRMIRRSPQIGGSMAEGIAREDRRDWSLWTRADCPRPRRPTGSRSSG